LHGLHPIEIPFDLAQHVGHGDSGLRNIQFHVLQAGAIHLIGPQQGAGGDSRVHHVAAVIAGIVPTLCGSVGAGLAGRGMIRAFQMTGVMFVAGIVGCEIHGDAATLAVEGSHGHLPGQGVDIRSDLKIPTAADAGDLDIVVSRNRPFTEICGLNLVSGIAVFGRRRERPRIYGLVIRRAIQRKCGSPRIRRYQRYFRGIAQIPNLVHLNFPSRGYGKRRGGAKREQNLFHVCNSIAHRLLGRVPVPSDRIFESPTLTRRITDITHREIIWRSAAESTYPQFRRW